MKIIDRRGKLFGIVNIFDLIVLTLIVLVALFAFKWAKTAEDPSWVKTRIFNTRCVAEVNVQPFLAEIIKPGDEVLNIENVIVGQVKEVISNEPAQVYVYYSKDGEKIFFDSENRKLAVIIDLMSYEKKGLVFSCATNNSLKVGESFQLLTNRYSIPAAIKRVLTEGGKQ